MGFLAGYPVKGQRAQLVGGWLEDCWVHRVQKCYQKLSELDFHKYPGGLIKVSNVNNFPASTTMSASLVTLYPGGIRELHWHTGKFPWGKTMLLCL